MLANDWERMAETMRRAYPNRKRLASGVTTPQMDALVKMALENGAEAAKVCGAGGGGCIAFLCARAGGTMSSAPWPEPTAPKFWTWKIDREGLIVTGG